MLPPETELWNRVEQTAREVFGTYGFGEIRPPIFEQTDLFARAVGGETDIVSKEMYSFEDHDWIELAQYRAALVVKSVSPGLPSEFSQFERSVLSYVDILSERMSAGDVPKTPDNEKALMHARKCLDEMNRAGTRFIGSQSGTDEIAFEQNLKGVKQALLFFRLGDVLSLRPEATASVCRAYIQHNMRTLTQPVKLYYMGPMFRRERPQKGRYRQFYQIGAEVLEALQPGQGGPKDIPKDAATDAEVIEMLMAFFARLDLKGIQLEINSIGHNAQNCRRGYVEKLRAALAELKDELEDDSRRRIEANPLRVLDSKVEKEQETIARLPRIGDYLCDDCAKHYRELKRQLDLREIKYKENWRLVRGLDYYMRTTFEIIASGLGSQNAVCGGGRYDGLVELLDGAPTKGIGFAIGEDRLILSLSNQERFEMAGPRADIMVTASGEPTWSEAVTLAARLRRQGLGVFVPSPGTRLNKALESADRQKIRVAIIVGESERASGNYVVRVLRPFEDESARDQQIPIDQIERYGKLAKLRNDLERKIKGFLGQDPKDFKGETIRNMVQHMEMRSILPPLVMNQFLDLVPLLNRAIHGERLTPGTDGWILTVGNLLLMELDKLKTDTTP